MLNLVVRKVTARLSKVKYDSHVNMYVLLFTLSCDLLPILRVVID
jgi:hypothetical protein